MKVTLEFCGLCADKTVHTTTQDKYRSTKRCEICGNRHAFTYPEMQMFYY